MSEHIERLRAFKFYHDRGQSIASDEARDALALLADFDALAARLAEAEAENARLVAANKARDEFLRGHRYKHSEVDGYINLCESQIATLKARLAEVEAGRDFLFASRDTERSAAALAIEELGARLVKAEALLDEAEQWLGDNDDEEATSRRIRKFLQATGYAERYADCGDDSDG